MNVSSNAERIKVFIPDDKYVWIAASLIDEGGSDGVSTFQIDENVYDDDDENNSNGFQNNNVKDKIVKVNLKKYGLTISSLPLQNIDNNDNDNGNDNDIGVEDMCNLSYLHEASILDNLRRRFKSKIPYTNTGDICIAVNPYVWLNIYTKEMKQEYYRHYRHEMSPHVYATSSMAFRGLRERRKNQSILVSGESGAGKTESVKILMDHIASFAGKEGDVSIDKVLKSNPLLESFGNAKTIRNDNSSRFGKFTQLQFDESCQLVGSKCVTYLLEKCRVVSQNPNERNYHIMYQILSAPNDVKKSLYLDGCKYDTFNYTSMGDIYTNIIEGSSDAERYMQTIDALKLLGVNPELCQQLQEAIAGILFLGQMEFIGDNDSASVDDKSQVGVTVLGNICKLLNLDNNDFTVALTTRTIEVEGTKIAIPLNIEQATGGRDALAKEIYARIFSWLVLIINYNTAFSPYNANMTLSHSPTPNSSNPKQKLIYGVISLLDIFGFECFDVNRFEQLCINFANEKLQQKFTMDVFKTVQEEYQSEGLNWELISFEDNAQILDMIEGKGGILGLLNEECLLPKGKDSAFLSKLKISCSSHPAFSINLLSQNEFIVSHYAGKVSYNVNGFLDRNKDTLPDDMCHLLISSKNKLLSNLFSYEMIFTGAEEVEDFVTKHRHRAGELLLQIQHNNLEDVANTPPNPPFFSTDRMKKGRPSLSGSTVASDIMLEGFSSEGKESSSFLSSSKKSFILAKTVTMKFKTSLHKLMEAIHQTEVQYVRCIKPNSKKSNTQFSRDMVVEQLRSAGMIEAIRISRAAYPYKMSQLDFIRRFAGLKTSKMNEKINAKTYCQHILTSLLAASDVIIPNQSDKNASTKMYEIGKTKVYFSAGVLEKLEAKRAKHLSDSVRFIQKVVRGLKQRKLYLLMRKSCILIQKCIRMRYTKKAYKLKLTSIIVIQSIVRVLICKNYIVRLRRYNAASTIQSYIKMLKQYKRFHKLKIASICIQSIGRMYIKHTRYIILRDQARARSDLKNRLFIAEQELEKEAQRREEVEQKLKRLEMIENDNKEETYLSLIETYKAEIQRLTNENTELRQKNQEYIMKSADQNQINIMLELEKERHSLNLLKQKIDEEGANLVLKAKKEIDDLKSKTGSENKSSSIDNEKHVELQTTKEKVSSMITKNGIKVTVFIKTSNRADSCTEKAGLIRMKSKRGMEDENTPNNELSFAYIECYVSESTETDDQHAVRKKMTFDIAAIDDIRKGKGKTLVIPDNINTDRCMHIIIENKGELNVSFQNMMLRDAAVMFFREIITQSAMGKMNKLLSPKIIVTSEKSNETWVRGRVRASDEVVTIKRISRK